MAIYRALNKLSNRVERGELTRLDWLTLEQIGRLENVGAVARVSAPPLVELPDWKSRAGRLTKVNVTTAEDFLEAPPELIAHTLRVKPETAARYYDEVQSWLIIQSNEE